ncbi:MAG: hypothetical protein ACR2LK_04415 [Solirubrobacteraceae bacterium]
MSAATLREYSSLRHARARAFYLWLCTRGSDSWVVLRDDGRADLGWTNRELDRAVDDAAARGWVGIEATPGGLHVMPWLADDDSPLAHDDDGEEAA